MISTFVTLYNSYYCFEMKLYILLLVILIAFMSIIVLTIITTIIIITPKIANSDTIKIIHSQIKKLLLIFLGIYCLKSYMDLIFKGETLRQSHTAPVVSCIIFSNCTYDNYNVGKISFVIIIYNIHCIHIIIVLVFCIFCQVL